MSKGDNVNTVLMTHCKVNLRCDNEKLQLRYGRQEGQENNTWYCNGENTELQVLGLIKMLREKYKSIEVIWKRQF